MARGLHNDTRALFHNGKLYFGFVRASDGKSTVSVFDLTTGRIHEPLEFRLHTTRRSPIPRFWPVGWPVVERIFAASQRPIFFLPDLKAHQSDNASRLEFRAEYSQFRRFDARQSVSTLGRGRDDLQLLS